MTERPPVVHPVLACFFGVTTWSVPRVLATLTAALVLVSPLVVNVPRAETIEEIENCYGNRIVYGELFEPNDLNPLAPDLNTSALRLREMIYEGLYTINKKGEYEPLLARSYRQVGDTLLVVSLRTDIWWHDGTKFKTDDVIFTYECLLQNAEFSSAEVRKLAGRIKHVRALGSDAIEFRVEQMPRFPEVLLAIRILPSHLFSNCTSDAIRSGLPDGRLRKPVGTGPFVFGQRHPFFGTVSLQANRDYYLYPAFDRELTRFGSRRGPFLDAIEMRPYPSAVGEVSDLRGGIINLIPTVDPQFIPELQAMPFIALLPYLTLSVRQLELSYELPLMSDLRLRRAISLAIDRDALIGAHLAGQAEVASGPYPGGTPFCPVKPRTLPYNQMQATQLIADLGYNLSPGGGYATNLAGNHIRLRLMVCDVAVGDRSSQICTAIQGYLKMVGIEVVLLPVNRSQLLEALGKGKGYDLAFSQMTIPINTSLIPSYAGNSALPTDVREEVRRLSEDLRRSDSPDGQRMTENEFHDRMAELLPSIYLWVPNRVAAFTMDTHNVDVHPTYFFSYIRNWYRKF